LGAKSFDHVSGNTTDSFKKYVVSHLIEAFPFPVSKTVGPSSLGSFMEDRILGLRCCRSRRTLHKQEVPMTWTPRRHNLNTMIALTFAALEVIGGAGSHS
jgi:hypothetical protein